MSDSPRAAVRFLFANMLLAAILGALTILPLAYAVDGALPSTREYLYGVQTVGGLAWVTLGVWSLGIGVVGLIASRLTRRNLLGAVGRIGAYTSGWLPIWVVVSVVAWCVLAVWAYVFPRSASIEIIGGICFGGLNLLFAIGYPGVVIRRIKYVRYANWQSALAAVERTTAPAAGVSPGSAPAVPDDAGS